MGGVNLNTRETRVGSELCREREAADHVLDVINGHLTRCAEEERVDQTRDETISQVQRHRAGAQCLLAETTLASTQGRLTARVVDLYNGRGAVAVARGSPGLPG